MTKEFDQLHNQLKEIVDLTRAKALMQWDQEVYMPPKSAESRAAQLATLNSIAHKMITDKKFTKLLDSLRNKDLSEKEHRNVDLLSKEIDKLSKLDGEFIKKRSAATSRSFEGWRMARKKNQWEIFEPLLEEVVNLKMEECEKIGYQENPYDVLLDDYDAGIKGKEIEQLFIDLKEFLIPFYQRLRGQKQVSCECLYHQYDSAKQRELADYLLQQMNYDFASGRVDFSPHPFTTSFSTKDVRMTIRIKENDISELITTTIHEGGHALYEQGLPTEDYGLPTSGSASTSIHESQSRLWENHIGRSHEFWKFNFPYLKNLFPSNLAKTNLEEFYFAINQVKPQPIRTEADELTYHLHILIRFELEKALFEGEIKVADLPAAWNEKYKAYLGVDIKSDAEGVLQDVHWSHGGFGYFPTYTLGSLYAAQFYDSMEKKNQSIKKEISNGNTRPVVEWLAENIFSKGSLYSSEDLCKKITGEKLNIRHFEKYIRSKYTSIYDLSPLVKQNKI